jgi:soluble lytic murein transglycosylase-like protein
VNAAWLSSGVGGICLIMLILLWLPRRALFVIAMMALGIGLGLAFRANSAPSIASNGVSIPIGAYLYGFKLEREVNARFGTTDDVARIAAQVHAESNWNSSAKSPYADGLAQFTPSTANWLGTICPEIGAADPWDPNWSMRAVVCYDAWLHKNVTGAAACDRWAFALSAYNGGLSWIPRDKSKAADAGADPERWFGQVENYTSRSAAARRENRAYVERILLELEPAYIAVGWPGKAVCP